MQISLPGVPVRSDDLLDFVVVGGGIAGIASAWSLRAAGHRVSLLEQRPSHVLSECRQGMRVIPSMTQVLNDWGIGDRLASIAAPHGKVAFVDGKSGEELGLVVVDGKAIEPLSGFGYVQYGALFRLFRDLAEDAGVHLHFGTRAVSVDPWQGTVTCQDGRQLTADVIIGADGTESLVRPLVLGPTAPPPEYDNIFTVCLVAPADLARQDPDLASLLDDNTLMAWLADDCSLQGALTGPGPDAGYTLVMHITIHDPDVRKEFPMSAGALKIHSFEPRVQKLFTFSEQLSKTLYACYEPFDSWVHESGKVVLVGEAAHPTIPFGSQTMSTCIEDAMTLSMLFSLPATKPQTPMLLNVYEELRQPRCACAQRYMRRKRAMLTMPHGPSQRRRDAFLGNQRACHQSDGSDDEFLHNTYMRFVQVYGFDAREAVQDWWVKLGRSICMRSPGTESEDDEDVNVDAPMLAPIIVDAQVERSYPTYPIISDPIAGEEDAIIREEEARRRSQQYSSGLVSCRGM